MRETASPAGFPENPAVVSIAFSMSVEEGSPPWQPAHPTPNFLCMSLM